MKIELDVLMKCIESMVLARPLYVSELITSLQCVLPEDLDNQQLEGALQALEEKYNADFFGIIFCYDHRQLFFASRPLHSILGICEKDAPNDVVEY